MWNVLEQSITVTASLFRQLTVFVYCRYELATRHGGSRRSIEKWETIREVDVWASRSILDTIVLPKIIFYIIRVCLTAFVEGYLFRKLIDIPIPPKHSVKKVSILVFVHKLLASQAETMFYSLIWRKNWHPLYGRHPKCSFVSCFGTFIYLVL